MNNFRCHKCGQAFSTVTSLSKHRRFCDSTPTPPTAPPYGLSPIKSPPPLTPKNGIFDSSPRSPSLGHRQIPTSVPTALPPNVNPTVAPPPPLYPGMLQPYLLQQAMASGAPLGSALPFYPNFLQQLARFQNQAQLSTLLNSTAAATASNDLKRPISPAHELPIPSSPGVLPHFTHKSTLDGEKNASLTENREKETLDESITDDKEERSFDVNRNKSINGTPELNGSCNVEKSPELNKTPLDLSLTKKDEEEIESNEKVEYEK